VCENFKTHSSIDAGVCLAACVGGKGSAECLVKGAVRSWGEAVIIEKSIIYVSHIARMVVAMFVLNAQAITPSLTRMHVRSLSIILRNDSSEARSCLFENARTHTHTHALTHTHTHKHKHTHTHMPTAHTQPHGNTSKLEFTFSPHKSDACMFHAW